MELYLSGPGVGDNGQWFILSTVVALDRILNPTRIIHCKLASKLHFHIDPELLPLTEDEECVTGHSTQVEFGPDPCAVFSVRNDVAFKLSLTLSKLRRTEKSRGSKEMNLIGGIFLSDVSNSAHIIRDHCLANISLKPQHKHFLPPRHRE